MSISLLLSTLWRNVAAFLVAALAFTSLLALLVGCLLLDECRKEMSMRATVGRQVHYYPVDASALGGAPNDPRAATVTRADPTQSGVGLFVLCNGQEDDLGIIPLSSVGKVPGAHLVNVPYSDEPTPGHWTWPPRAGN